MASSAVVSKEMGGTSSFIVLTFLIIIIQCITPPLHATPSNARGALEIDIGIGIGFGGSGQSPSPSSNDCPPPPPPPCPPPPKPINIGGTRPPRPPPPKRKPPPSPLSSYFLNNLQYKAYRVIQRFRKTITEDPMNITATWMGYRPCNYKGFACETPPNRKNTPTIASVDFNGRHLAAPTIAGFIDRLPDLAIFHANSNKFRGTVPDLRGLQFLYELDLSNNKLSGAFPTNVLPLYNLTFLDIRFNAFTGGVPAAAFRLPVDVLFLNNNNFAQPLPANLGSTPALYLTLANNQFTGPIPKTIANAANTLREVLFLGNRLSGCLPYEVGLLRKTTVFDAGNNVITGPIPHSFGCLAKVEQLNLANNLLYGEVPDVVCRLAKSTGRLMNLSLSGNYFTSVGASCYPLIKSGVLDVRRNCIHGLPGQRSPEECNKFWFHRSNSCPLLLQMPCWHSHRKVHGGRAAELAAPPGYSAYTALTKGHGS